MKKNDGNSEDILKVEEFEKLKNFKTEEKLKFNFWWWRDPPYKNDDFRHRVQLS